MSVGWRRYFTWPALPPPTTSLSAGLFLQPVVLTLAHLPALFSSYFICWYHWKPYNQLVTSFIFHIPVLVVKQIVCCEYSYLNMSKEVSWFLCLRSVDLTKVLLSLFCFSKNYWWSTVIIENLLISLGPSLQPVVALLFFSHSRQSASL